MADALSRDEDAHSPLAAPIARCANTRRWMCSSSLP
jgi:hypothetical protein